MVWPNLKFQMTKHQCSVISASRVDRACVCETGNTHRTVAWDRILNGM